MSEHFTFIDDYFRLLRDSKDYLHGAVFAVVVDLTDFLDVLTTNEQGEIAYTDAFRSVFGEPAKWKNSVPAKYTPHLPTTGIIYPP